MLASGPPAPGENAWLTDVIPATLATLAGARGMPTEAQPAWDWLPGVRSA